MPLPDKNSTALYPRKRSIGSRRSKLAGTDRSSFGLFANLIANWSYTIAFFLVYKNYLSVEWSYALFHYREMSFGEWSFAILSISIASIFLPKRIDSPSSMILWLLHSFILVPVNIITFMIGEHSPLFYIPSLASMTFIMALAGYLSSKRIKKSAISDIAEKDPDLKFIAAFVIVFIFFSFILYFYFQEILTFSGIDDIYYQRFAASEIGGGIIGYIRTHYAFVFAPALIAIGLSCGGYRYLIVLGTIGGILVYMIDASKIALIMPIAMIVFYLLIKFHLNGSYIFTAGLTLLTVICSLLTSQVALIKLVADLLILRSIAIPAQTFALYADLFTSRNYTWWSNVRGINLFVSPPEAFTADPFWPVLGQIVGAEYYGFGSRTNSNANLFVGEGVAAGGFIGVLVIGFIFILFLEALDQSAKQWNRMFTIIATVPIGLSLTNTHLSTLMLSFGGFFWLLLFRYYKPA